MRTRPNGNFADDAQLRVGLTVGYRDMPKRKPTTKPINSRLLTIDESAKQSLVGALPSDLLQAHKRRRVLSSDAVLEIVPFGRTQLPKLSSEGLFPHPIRLSTGRVAWIEREIFDWLEEREAERDEMLAERAKAVEAAQ